MLTHQEFELWCEHLKFPSAIQSLIARIRAAEPARRVKSASGNVSGCYPSRKMGCTIQFESHRNELATILELEYDPTIREYYDQPPANQAQLSCQKRQSARRSPYARLLRDCRSRRGLDR